LQRFKNEAQAAAHLHHTHIVPVFGVGCERGVHYYAMQFIDGQTLAAVIDDLRRQAGEASARENGEGADPQWTGPYVPPPRSSPDVDAAAGGEVPPDVLTGFLPPEDGTGRGMGYFSYTIQPKAGLATGTAIRNVALITFDANPSIATDQVDEHDPTKGVDPAKQALVTIANVVQQYSLSEPAGTAAPPSIPIARLIGHHYHDPDKNTRPGIAVIALSGNGTWQYNGGSGWVSITGVSETNALLLPQADQLRFVPAGVSTGQAQLLYVGWDGSRGTSGGRADASQVGGGTPFSANAGEVTVTLTAITHAPV
jgi:hypothetical protein